MARGQGGKTSRARSQPHSGLVNKTGMAVVMGAVGLGGVFAVRLLAPALVPFALVLLVLGIASAFLTVGPTYSGTCPHCGKALAYKHAYGVRSFRCRSCKGRVRFLRRGDGFEFDRG